MGVYLQIKVLWGLGVKDLETFNKALSGKWVWIYLHEGESLWARVVRSSCRDSWWDGLSGGSRGRVVEPSG